MYDNLFFFLSLLIFFHFFLSFFIMKANMLCHSVIYHSLEKTCPDGTFLLKQEDKSTFSDTACMKTFTCPLITNFEYLHACCLKWVSLHIKTNTMFEFIFLCVTSTQHVTLLWDSSLWFMNENISILKTLETLLSKLIQSMKTIYIQSMSWYLLFN